MNQKIISIEITPNSDSVITENGGVMWEHNATVLKFIIDPELVGDYRYYIEYRSLMGTRVRTDYLELNTEDNTIIYPISVTMSSLKGVECWFNIVSIDDDGNTVQVMKPEKFCLTFDYSPDTDNQLCKANEFSINSLLEAIRLGTFKGDQGEKGDKGDKGDKGETGGISEEYATSNFSNALKGSASGEIIAIDDVSPIEHKVNAWIHGKNIFNGELLAGILADKDFAVTPTNPTVFKSIKTFLKAGVYTISFGVKVNIVRAVIDGVYQTIPNVLNVNSYTFETKTDGYVGCTFRDATSADTEWGETTSIQIETGKTATEYTQYIDPSTVTLTEETSGITYTPNLDGICEVVSCSPVMTLSTDTEGMTIECEYNRDINKIIEKLITAITLLGGEI